MKKTEIFDKQGVLQRTDVIAKLQQQLDGAQQQIKKLAGDLQTAHRESIQSRKRTEVEKFKTQVKGQQLDSEYNNKLAVDRLKDAVKLESERLRIESKDKKS